MSNCKKCLSEEVCRYNDGVNLYCKEKYECPHLKNKADFEEVDKISPCDVCAYNPPSSFDGKPCALCPATRKKGAIHNG